MKLEIEPIPNHSWGLSLANTLFLPRWRVLRTNCFKEAKYTCQICEEDDRDDLTCHEIWRFDDVQLTQTLVGLECCCSLCHNVHHFGRSKLVYSVSYVRRLMKHWVEVNELTYRAFIQYEEQIHKMSVMRANWIYKVIVDGKELKEKRNE